MAREMMFRASSVVEGVKAWSISLRLVLLGLCCLGLAACDSGPQWQYEGYRHHKVTISLEGEIYELENGFRSASKRNNMINVGGFVGASWKPPLYKVLDDGRVILAVTHIPVSSPWDWEGDYNLVCRNEACSEWVQVGVAVLDDATDPQTLRPYLLRGFGEEAEAYGGEIELLEVEVADVREDTRKWPAADVPWLAGAEELVRRGERKGGKISYADDEERRRLRENWDQPNSSSFFEGQTFCLNLVQLAGAKAWRPLEKLEMRRRFSGELGLPRQFDERFVHGVSTWDPIAPVIDARTGIDWIDEELNQGDGLLYASFSPTFQIVSADLTLTRSACAFEWPNVGEIDLGTYELTPNHDHPNAKNTAIADDASLFVGGRIIRIGPESFYGFGQYFLDEDNFTLLQQAYTGAVP